MDPVLAGSFATIVGLVCNFLSVKEGKEKAGFDEFMRWLSAENHNELVQLIEGNQKTLVSIKALLSYNQRELLSKLSGIDRLLALICTKIDGLSDLSDSLYPGNQLSEQAITVLKELKNSGKSDFYVSKYLDGRDVIDFRGKGILPLEQQFLEDDLNTLVELGFLRVVHGNEIEYHITRKADRYLQQL